MEDTILPDLDDASLPDLPDSVWMRLLANALDPDTPDVGLDLIPVDLPPDSTSDDDFAWDADETSDSDNADDSAPFDSTDDLADHHGGEQFSDHGWQSDPDTSWHQTDQDPYSDQI